MKIQQAVSNPMESPGLLASSLPPQILDRATLGLCQVTMLSAGSCIVLTGIEHFLQPEFAKAWTHPVLRITSLSVLFLSIAVAVVLRMGWLRKDRLLDLGLFFQVATAFACALFEGAAYENPNSVVLGHSGIAAWMLLCGFLMPRAPLRAALAAVLCVAMWPLGYWVDLQLFGYQPMPLNRMLVWTLPLAVIGVWMFILNHRVISSYVKQERAENIGSYVLDSILGYGGMGEVWKAKHKLLARDAAIKLIRPETLRVSTGRQEALLRKRFEREAQVTASLRSPHTVALYDFGHTTEGAFYYVMELLDGIDLQTLVERYGPLDQSRVVHVLYQACQSLEEAHRAGLVHRDIKPRNILLTKLGLEHDFTKILDFGLVKSPRTEGQEESMLTIDGVTTGTPAYLSPEIALGQREIDGRADLYSLGAVAYFLLTGHLVFDEASPTAFAIAHVQKPPVPVSQRAELPVSPGLEAIVMRLLEKDPANRFQSALELSRSLRALRDVKQWCPDAAARWWETNLPTSSAPASEANRETALAAISAGDRVHA